MTQLLLTMKIKRLVKEASLFSVLDETSDWNESVVLDGLVDVVNPLVLWKQSLGTSWNVDLGLAVGQPKVNLAVLDCLAVSRGVEDVADLGSVSPLRSQRLDIDCISLVCQSHEEVASVEAEDVVQNVSFFLRVLPNLMSFSGVVDGFDELIDLTVCVHALPQGLSVLWVVSATVPLLTSVVEEGDTSSSQGKGKCSLELSSLGAVVVKESSVVVIVNEQTEGINVLELGCFLVESISNVEHGLARSKDVLDGVVHGVVENSS